MYKRIAAAGAIVVVFVLFVIYLTNSTPVTTTTAAATPSTAHSAVVAPTTQFRNTSDSFEGEYCDTFLWNGTATLRFVLGDESMMSVTTTPAMANGFKRHTYYNVTDMIPANADPFTHPSLGRYRALERVSQPSCDTGKL